MSKRSKKLPLSQQNKDFSLFHWITLLGLAGFFLFAPYYRGLFNSFTYNFEPPIYGSMLFIFILFLFATVYIVRVWRIDNIQGVLSIGVLLLPAIYWLSSFQAVASHNASLMTFIYFLYALLFILGTYMSTTAASVHFIQQALYVAGYGVVFFGLFNMLGLIYEPDAIWFTSGDYRLSSVFQYSNTYAGYLLAIFLCAAFGSMNARRTYEALFHAVMLVPILLSFMLTYSRGALVILPPLVLIVLLFMRLDRQISYLVTLLVSAVATVSILGFITERYIKIAAIVLPQSNGTPANTIPLWDPLALHSSLILIAASGVTAAIVYAIRSRRTWLADRTSKWNGRMSTPFIVPAILTITGILGAIVLLLTNIASSILPQSIAGRLENINFQQHSVLERMTFYKDAMRVVADYPLLGSGGGGWSALYEQYQNNPYVSRQAHSYFIQTLVEVGWVGFLALTALIISVLYFYLRNYWRQRDEQPAHFMSFILLISLLAHSLIDFDMSFTYLGTIVFFTLGLLLAIYKEQLVVLRWSSYSESKWRYVYTAFAIVLTIVVTVQVAQEYAANRQFKLAINKAMSGESTIDGLMIPLDQALSNSPNHPAYISTKVDWLNQAYQQLKDPQYLLQTKEILASTLKDEPYERLLILAKYRNHKDLQEYNEMISTLEEGISKFQWDIKFYEAAIMEYALHGQRLVTTDQTASTASLERGLELYHNVLTRMSQLQELPPEQLQGRTFETTPFIRQAVGQIYYELNRYTEAITILEPLHTGDLDDPYTRIGVRYYLAALQQLGQNNENLAQLLINADPNERMYLDQLYQTK